MAKSLWEGGRFIGDSSETTTPRCFLGAREHYCGDGVEAFVVGGGNRGMRIGVFFLRLSLQRYIIYKLESMLAGKGVSGMLVARIETF